MFCSVLKDSLHLVHGKTKICRYFKFVFAGFPIVNDIVNRHSRTFQHGPATLHTKLNFGQGTLGPIHRPYFSLVLFHSVPGKSARVRGCKNRWSRISDVQPPLFLDPIHSVAQHAFR